MKILRLLLAAAFVASSLLQAWFAETAWAIGGSEAGAIAVILAQLSLLAAGAALWQFMIATGYRKNNSPEARDREMFILSALFFLQGFPLAIVFDLAGTPFAAASIALMLGLLPVLFSLARERRRT